MSIKADIVPRDMNAYSLDMQRDHDFQVHGLVNQTAELLEKRFEVAVREFIESAPDPDKQLPVLAAILQSKYETMKKIAENMTLTREERKELEERRERIEKLRTLAKERELDEKEAMRLLDLILTTEDKALLEKQLMEQPMVYA